MSEPVKFEVMQRYINRLLDARKPAVKNHPEQRDKPARTPIIKRSNNVRRIGGHTAKNAYTLAYARMSDMQKLAELRGGKFTDLRKTVIYAFALSASWYCHSVQQLRREVECFIDEHIENPDAYRAAHMPSTVIDRKEQSLEGVTIEGNGQQWDARYRIRNDTLINLLQVTPTEQKHMTSIISTAEKYARNNLRRNQKRWDQGKVTRQAYESMVSSRRQLALELSAAGATQADIAKALNVSVRSVRNYVKA